MKRTKELIYQNIITFVFAMLYALFITLGDYDRALASGGIRTMGRLAGWTLLMFALLSALFLSAQYAPAAGKWLADAVGKGRTTGYGSAGRRMRAQARRRGLKVAALFSAVCFLCWLPYFLLNFPGWVSNDTVWQLEQACGWAPPSNHHPWLHTMIIRCFFMLGYRIFGTYTGAVATFVFAQMAFMSLVYASVLYDFYIHGARWVWIALALLFYACLPVNGLYAVCMSKDVLFSGVLLLFARAVRRYALPAARDAAQSTAENRIIRWIENNRCYLYIGMTGLLVCLLRSNGILVFAGTAAGLITTAIIRKNWRGMTLVCAAALVCYGVWQGPVLRASGVVQPDTIEGLTMPTQQLLCTYLKGGSLTEEEIGLLNEAVPVEWIASYYNPYYFDIVKEYIRAEGNQQVIADNMGQYFGLWLRAGLRNPARYLEAQVRQTCGYWRFDVDAPIYEQYRMAQNPFGLTVQRKFFSYDSGLWADEFLMSFQDFYNRVWSIGLTTWTMFACMAYALRRRRSCLVYLPYVMLFVSLLLAAPVHAEFRYTYGIFVALPFLIGAAAPGAEEKEKEEAE